MSKRSWAVATFATLAASVVSLLVISSCGGGGKSGSSATMPTEPPVAGSKTVMIQIVDDSFNPKDVVINAGDTVEWVSATSTTTHTVTADNGSFDSGMIFTGPGKTFSQTFPTSGVTINYHCKTHQACCGMQGAVKVGNTAPPPLPGY
jgi:plastocyanin